MLGLGKTHLSEKRRMSYEHHTHRDPDLAPRWCVTYMASQCELGILSQRWIGPSALDLNHFGPDRSVISSAEPRLTQTYKEASMTRASHEEEHGSGGKL
jgi:hypothetical protein